MLFNLVGYRWIFTAIDNKATAKLEQKISSGDYNEEQLVEIQIPLNMPYYSDKEYENVYGETDWNGNHYRFVKRKVSGNTLFLLCLPNAEKNSIVKAKDEFTKAVNDFPANKQGSQPKNSLLKLITTEFRVNEVSVAENNFFSNPLILFQQQYMHKHNYALRSLEENYFPAQRHSASLRFCHKEPGC